MLGILVQLALSWLVLWLFEKKNLSVLGWYPSASRLKAFILFFLIAGLCAAFEIFLRVRFFKERYQLNPVFSFTLLWQGFQWNLISVLYEELIFRGALLYVLIKRWEVRKALMVSAAAFGIYHWFSNNLFGNPVAMIYIFMITGIMGWVLAYAYAKTASMYIAIGFHLGWNFIYGFVFSKGSIGNGVFMQAPQHRVVTISYFVYYTVMLLPVLLAFLSSYLAVRKWKTANSSAVLLNSLKQQPAGS